MIGTRRRQRAQVAAEREAAVDVVAQADVDQREVGQPRAERRQRVGAVGVGRHLVAVAAQRVARSWRGWRARPRRWRCGGSCRRRFHAVDYSAAQRRRDGPADALPSCCHHCSPRLPSFAPARDRCRRLQCAAEAMRRRRTAPPVGVTPAGPVCNEASGPAHRSGRLTRRNRHAQQQSDRRPPTPPVRRPRLARPRPLRRRGLGRRADREPRARAGGLHRLDARRRCARGAATTRRAAGCCSGRHPTAPPVPAPLLATDVADQRQRHRRPRHGRASASQPDRGLARGRLRVPAARERRRRPPGDAHRRARDRGA